MFRRLGTPAGRRPGPVFPAQTARRLRALPSASLAPILSGWKQTSGGAEMCELSRRGHSCAALCIQDKTRTAPSNRPRRTSSPRRENGEAREIYFEEPEVVITDVPRSVQFGRY